MTTCEPFDETAQRRLMQLYALSGNRTRAIHAYHAFAKLLETEIGTLPLPETQALARTIQNGQAAVEADIPTVTTQRRTWD